MSEQLTHYRKLLNPNYLGGYSLNPGEEIILTIKEVKQETVTGVGGKKEECPVCHWQEKEKPMILNATNMGIIKKLTGSPYVEQWAGHQVQIYFDPKVKFGSDTPGGLRIREKKPEASNIACEECGQFIKPAFNMKAADLAAYTKKKYGKKLCADCAKAASGKEEKKSADTDA